MPITKIKLMTDIKVDYREDNIYNPELVNYLINDGKYNHVVFRNEYDNTEEIRNHYEKVSNGSIITIDLKTTIKRSEHAKILSVTYNESLYGQGNGLNITMDGLAQRHLLSTKKIKEIEHLVFSKWED